MARMVSSSSVKTSTPFLSPHSLALGCHPNNCPNTDSFSNRPEQTFWLGRSFRSEFRDLIPPDADGTIPGGLESLLRPIAWAESTFDEILFYDLGTEDRITRYREGRYYKEDRPATGAIAGPEPSEWIGERATSSAPSTPPLDVTMRTRPSKPAS